MGGAIVTSDQIQRRRPPWRRIGRAKSDASEKPMILTERQPGFARQPRHRSVGVRVGGGAGAVTVGAGAPIVVQSMTNTNTADVEGTARQVAALARAGS